MQVLSYICQVYNLHNTAVFSAAAESHCNQLLENFRQTKFIFGTKCQRMSISRYSGDTIVTTSELRPHNTLSITLDQEQIRACSAHILRLMEKKTSLEEAIASATERMHQTESLYEPSQQHLRDLTMKLADNRVG
jgi:hypothetical protein